ncbi:hypothetical protein ACFX2I_022699 [Malus domestica]
MMKFYMLLDFVGILRETLKLFLKNVKLMSCIILLIISLSSILLVSNMYSIKLSLIDFTLNAALLPSTVAGTPDFNHLLVTLKEDLRLFAGLEWLFISASCFASLFFTTASILASGVTYRGQDLSVKELLSRAVKSLKRPFVTWFYIALLDLGFYLFIIVFLLPLLLTFGLTYTTPAFSKTVFLLALVFQAYLAVVWNLALVVSVLEEKSGIEALGKAGQLIKGSTLRGFFLNLLSGAFSLLVFYGWHKTGTTVKSLNAAMIPLLLMNLISCFIRMSMLMIYTVLYHKCKETHGEELEMQGSTEYTKVATSASTPFISADVA